MGMWKSGIFGNTYEFLQLPWQCQKQEFNGILFTAFKI